MFIRVLKAGGSGRRDGHHRFLWTLWTPPALMGPMGLPGWLASWMVGWLAGCMGGRLSAGNTMGGSEEIRGTRKAGSTKR
jgi:hypothetical protein